MEMSASLSTLIIYTVLIQYIHAFSAQLTVFETYLKGFPCLEHALTELDVSYYSH